MTSNNISSPSKFNFQGGKGVILITIESCNGDPATSNFSSKSKARLNCNPAICDAKTKGRSCNRSTCTSFAVGNAMADTSARRCCCSVQKNGWERASQTQLYSRPYSKDSSTMMEVGPTYQSGTAKDARQNGKLPLLPPRYHGPGCAMEVAVLEKHEQNCPYKKANTQGRSSDDTAADYEYISRVVLKTCTNDVRMMSKTSGTLSTVPEEVLTDKSSGSKVTNNLSQPDRKVAQQTQATQYEYEYMAEPRPPSQSPMYSPSEVPRNDDRTKL